LKNKDFSNKSTPSILKTLIKIKAKTRKQPFELSENSENSIKLYCKKQKLLYYYKASSETGGFLPVIRYGKCK